MKKNIIYTLCILLSGAFFFSSCEDMLETESTAVDSEFGKLTLNDSVYSVLGILKSMQNIGDRQVLLGELRGDLVSVVEDKATLELQDISKFVFNEDNQYLNIKDYYTIINNCNVFLSRVDTTIVRNNKKAMLGEFLAVTSVRAWTYLQLAINYDKVRYFTKPLLTHGDVMEEMAKAPISRNELLDILINELTPYENPRVYTMPQWSGVKAGNGVSVATNKLFVPIRLLLGELHLWRGYQGDYSAAANYYYKMLSDSPRFPSTSGYIYFTDAHGGNVSFDYNVSNGNFITNRVDGNYYNQFRSETNILSNYGYGGSLALIPYQMTTTTGSISEVKNIFTPQVAGMSQAIASQGYVGLSNRQTYYAYDGTGVIESKYNPAGNNGYFQGDLRRYNVTGTSRSSDAKETYSNIILKFSNPSLGSSVTENGYMSYNYSGDAGTNYISLYREAHIFMRYAEALLGMERFEGYTFLRLHQGKNAVWRDYEISSPAMDILKRGMDAHYYAFQNPTFVPATQEEIDENNYILKIVQQNGDTLKVADVLATNAQFIDMNFYSSNPETTIEDMNSGIHARGSGNSEYNKYYALNDTCIARYNGELEETNVDGNIVVTLPEYTREDSLSYVADLLLDELALEFCFEGHRFGDLIRFAKAAEKAGDPNWKDILVKRVAGRGIKNSVSYRANDYQTGEDYGLYDESKWYLPFPNSDFVNPEDTYDPNERPEENPEENPEDNETETTPDENTPEQEGGEVTE